ncbi:protein NETWORKED 2A [Manihot esculenta]|uniref:NAB domain-containing protein n=1 Tax=Manihot esculenta TaxID=3983 RepID=A0A2C9UVN0_MANES|nr:protein NETWORKED 2A [Manihot esculenta]OAY35737.1 hypothetical protein MANES_12G126100v8 [Manihot esculenta]
MLQRAASNAYSWWMASHIRTKQSKWLEQNLLDMEEKVQTMLKLIEEDGDSFAKRAEMYYKRRPELIYFVEESFRAYRALAERYDHISTELQNANNTIASVFPEQVQFMEDEEDRAPPRFPKKSQEASKTNVPKVPKTPKEVKGISHSAPKNLQSKKSMKTTNSANVPKSGLSKSKGLKEIDKLQKEILTLQTEKEFAKSSYEGGLAKYWEIDEKIREMQAKVCSLQDEFGSGTVIEDDEARELMASAALKSCQETLARLEEKQEKSVGEAMVEGKRINDAREKLKSLKDEFLNGEINHEKPKAKDKPKKAVRELKNLDQEPSIVTQERKDLEKLSAKIKEHLEVESNASLSVTELAETIDGLVNKVISLEAAVSTQTALVQRLRAETDDLQAQIGILEDDKATLINGKNDLREKLKEMEVKLLGLQELNRNIEDQNNILQTNFTETHYNLGHISDKLHDLKPDEEHQATPQTERKPLVEVEPQQEVRKQERAVNGDDNLHGQEGALQGNGSLQATSQTEPKPVEVEPQQEVRRQEGAVNGNDSLHKQEGALHDNDSLQAIQQTEQKPLVEVEPQQEVRSQEGEVNGNNSLHRQEGALHGNDSLHEEQKINSEEKSEVLGKQHIDVERQEGAWHGNDDLHELQKTNSEADSKNLGKQQGDKRQEGAQNDKGHLHEPQKLKSEEGDKVSGKPRKELRRQQVALSLNDSPNESQEQLKVPDSLQKEKNPTAEVNSQAESKEREEKLDKEELKVSQSSQKEKEFSAEVNLQAELKGQGVEFNLEDPKVSGRSRDEEVHGDINRQEDALNDKNDLHEQEKLKSEKENKVSGKPRKELRRQQVALSLNDSPNESQPVELQEELKVPDSLQKEKNLTAEDNSLAESKELEEKLNKEDLKISQSSQKEKEFSAEVNLQAELKGGGIEFNPEDFKVSGRSHDEEVHCDINRQEGALNDKNDLHEPHQLKSEKGHKVSSKPRKELRRQQVGLCLNDSPNESQHMELQEKLKVPDSLEKEKKLPAEVNSQAESNDREERLSTEELKVSESSHKEKDFSAEVNGHAELKGQGQEQEEKLNPEDVKVSGRSHEESTGRGSALGPDGILDAPQVKSAGEIGVLVSSHKEKATYEKKEEIKEHDLSISNRNRGEDASLLQTSGEIDDPLEKSHDMNLDEKVDKQDSAKAVENLLFETLQVIEQDDEPDWKHLFMNGLGNREKNLLNEYTTILRSYKEAKKQLADAENKNGDDLFAIMLQLKELRSANAKKDEHIKILTQKLSLLQRSLGEDNGSEKSTESQKLEREEIDDVDLMMMEQPEISPIEEKFRTSIDELLEENLDFWLRFSTTLYQIQKFETEIKDLQSELLKLEEKRKQDSSTNAKYSLKSDAKPLYKHLQEIHTELAVWIEKGVLLKDELKSRFSSLCDIQEEITAALKESAEDDDFKFTSYQAAKFRGEVLNMKQENNKVADELQAGLDHVTTLQLEVENTLAKLNEEFNLGESKNHQNIELEHSDSRAGVPLRSFIFGNKPKKQKHSILSCVHPVLQKKYNGFRTGMNN